MSRERENTADGVDLPVSGVLRAILKSVTKNLSTRAADAAKALRVLKVRPKLDLPKAHTIAKSAEKVKGLFELQESYRHSRNHDICSDKRGNAVSPSVTTPSKFYSLWATLKQVSPVFLKSSITATVLYTTYERICTIPVHSIAHFPVDGINAVPVSPDKTQLFRKTVTIAAICGTATGAIVGIFTNAWNVVATRIQYCRYNLDNCVSKELLKPTKSALYRSRIPLWIFRSNISHDSKVPQNLRTALSRVRIFSPGPIMLHCCSTMVLFTVYEILKECALQFSFHGQSVKCCKDQMDRTFSSPHSKGTAVSAHSSVPRREQSQQNSTAANYDQIVRAGNEKRAMILVNVTCIGAAGGVAGILSDIVAYYLDPIKNLQLGKILRLQTANTSIDILNTAYLRSLARSITTRPTPPSNRIIVSVVPHGAAFIAYEYGKTNATSFT